MSGDHCNNVKFQHVVFNDKSNWRTHLSPNVQLLCNSQLDLNVERIKLPKYMTKRDLERETNGCAVMVCRKPYRVVWKYKSLLKE